MNKGEIWLVELMFKTGREQSGTRPCIIIAPTKTKMVIVVPLTSNLQALRFADTIQIKRSLENNLEKNSVGLIFHLQSIDKRRLIRNLGRVEKIYMNDINARLKHLLSI